MKFKFKIQQYQTDAVENTVEIFAGQPCHDNSVYRRDIGHTRGYAGGLHDEEEYTGYRNSDVELSEAQLLANIHRVQIAADIKQSSRLVKLPDLGCAALDIEMETGTGKTYVYIKTMFEMNKRYGWSKFIVVVPSIAIREGVAKSFNMLEEHFMEHYGKKARWFIYNSGNLQALDSYSSSADINVMIINTQAFASSLKEGGRSKDSLIIYSKRDEFQSRRPIDVIAANRPIIIMDEPQRMEGAATQNGLKKFRPLFMLYYSATHRTQHNTIYALDALDAFKQKLVKRIRVKGFEVKNLRGTGKYMYLSGFELSKNKPPQAVIEIEVRKSGGIRREQHRFSQGDSLQAVSGLNEYDGYTISEINPLRGYVAFLNGEVLGRGQVVGDTNRRAMQKVQIRETIASHFEKERSLFNQGIKCLSLFFIDEVAHYKGYDENGEVVKGQFWKDFEEEYNNFLNEHISLFDEPYQRYLRQSTAAQVHAGYFSIDKRTGRSVNSHVGRGDDTSDDISAYDLILKNKERLLSFSEPVRFIFSHSALREGWDNPNVFQICTLRNAGSVTAKRQEVGRGLRLCVNQQGNRMDAEVLGENVQELNSLTVIANESYSSFVDALQRETRQELRERPTHVNLELFKGKTIVVDGEKFQLDEVRSAMAVTYFTMNGYIDEKGIPTDAYRTAVKEGTLASMDLFVNIAPIAAELHKMVQSTYDESVILDSMIEDDMQTPATITINQDNFGRKEFQELWKQINHKYAYTVHYSSDELVEKAINSLNASLKVTELKYVVVEGGQEDKVDEFGGITTATKSLSDVSTSTVKYDLVGEIARGATLTRRTVVRILQGLTPQKFALFRNNPEEFIRNAIRLIREQKATMIVEHIGYNMIDGQYESTIFTQEKPTQPLSKAFHAKKHILDYVFTDSKGEREFAEQLDAATEVCVYAKLPRTFQIPTPVGNYAPDWAVAFNRGSVKHIFFIAETKGSLDEMELRGVERAKIDCAKKLFNECSTANVKYSVCKPTYQSLLEAMSGV